MAEPLRRGRKCRDDLLECFQLDPRKKGRTKGNRQKVALVAALASDVELLILDEPTSGLDPLMEEQFREVVRDEKRRPAPPRHPGPLTAPAPAILELWLERIGRYAVEG